MTTISKAPKWPEGKEPTPFEKAVQVSLVEGTDNVFAGVIYEDRCDASGVAFGGLCISLIFAATRAYFNITHPSRHQPDPLNISTQFLLPVPAGAFHLTLHPEKLGRNLSVLRAVLVPTTTPSPAITASVTHGNLTTPSGPSLPTPRLALPDRHTCVEWSDPLFAALNPATTRCRLWTAPGGATAFWTPALGRHRRDAWARLADEEARWDLLSLGCLADWVPAMPLNYGFERDVGGFFGRFASRTVSLSVDVRRDPGGCRWLFQRAVMNQARGGRFDTEVKIVDEEGELVASVQQANMLVPRRGSAAL